MDYTNLPISLAWEVFGVQNGVDNYSEFRQKILDYRESHGRFRGIDPEIGCSILSQPFFFDREDWIPIPEDWKLNIVRGKMVTVPGSNEKMSVLGSPVD